MKIGEFAEMNHVTTKMLRHYDEIGLLKPAEIDYATGYRSYEAEQSNYLNWILILKSLDFTLAEIKEMLGGPVDGKNVLHKLIRKRIEFSSAMNEQIQKKIEIDRLIKLLEKEGFQMDIKINLLDIDQGSVHEFKKNLPNMEVFLETALGILSLCDENDEISVFRFDISRFKQINDDYGFEVGDRVIVACYNIFKSNVEKCLDRAAIGRAHGDEFIALARAGKPEIERVTRSIVADMESCDFSTTGCNAQVGCKIGALIGKCKNITNIRKMIDSSIEVINQAKKLGANGVLIQEYGA